MLIIVTIYVNFCNNIEQKMKFIKANILYIYKSIKNTELRLKMAFLLLLHQKMRLQRKQNQLTLKQLRFSSLVERMQKKVDKREKYYAKLEKQLERQANAYKNSANMYFSNMAGLGTNSVNMMNYNGTSAAAMQILQQFGGTNPYDGTKFNSDIAMAVMQGSGNIKTKVENGKYIYTDANGNDITSDVEQANKIISIANGLVSQQQQQANLCKQNYEQNVSIWLEAQQEQLEAQKEWEMDMLSEEQADLEAEKNSVEAQLELIKNEKQSIEQALGQAIQDAAPKFGLA